jgi:uncharacterized membrane protein
MLRILPFVLVVFLLPFVAHWLYQWLRVGDPLPEYIRKAPLLVLGGVGAFLVLAVLVSYATFTGDAPGTTYHPPIMKDGKIRQGHFD